MGRQHSHSSSLLRRGLCLAACLFAVSAHAIELSRGAHRSVARPPNVPADFVVTPNGFFHPSCVVELAADEVLGHDLLVRGLDGRSRRTVAPCSWPHYSASGTPVLPGPSETEPTSSFYDGWLTSYWYTGNLALGTAVSGKWIVPPVPADDPTGTNAIVIFYFNDVEMETGNNNVEILQPVLGFDQSNDNEWTVQGWNCCDSGIQKTSTALKVNAGDIIEGTTAGTGCNATTGVCATWTVTTADLTTGQSTVLNTTEPNAPNILNPAVLEAYGVTACNMLPPGGAETFFDHTVTDAAGATQALSYYQSNGGSSGVPSCGYGGSVSGSNYTLIYGNPAPSIATTTTVSTPSLTVHVGAAVPLTATVATSSSSPAFSGTVVFTDGSVVLGQADATPGKDASGHEQGVATLSLPTLSGGTHQITARFEGDNGYQPSTSAVVTIAVTKWPTTTTLVAAPTSVNEGVTSVLTATVASASGNAPALTGNVVFSAGSNGLGGVLLSAGMAVFDASALMVGTDAITASYAGDANYAPSSSTPASVTVASTLALMPQTANVPPRGSATFATTGGVAPIVWKLATNASGGSIDSETGAYRAGSKPEVTDQIVATDKAGATAGATVQVGAGVSITPATVSTATGGTIAFRATGGSGSGYQWALTSSNSRGSINASSGAYQAGASGGTDAVSVTDSLGNTASAQVTVTSQDSGSTGPTGATAGTGMTGPAGTGCACGVPGAGGFNGLAAAPLLWAAMTGRRRRRIRLSSQGS